VRATNSQGDSSPSDDSAPAVADAVPASPAKPTATSGGSRVAVSLPASNGDPIFKTSATCTSSNGGVTRSAVTQPEDLGETFSPIAVIGLTNGRTYTCKVSATNDVGTSPLSPASNAVIPRAAPGAPIGVKAVSGTATGSLGPVNVVFTAGNGNGSPITSFRATCTDLSTGLKVAKTGTHSPIAVGGLTAGHTFSCVAFENGPGGTSVASAAAKVILGAPGVPVIARVVQKNHAVTLSLLAPASNGKPITRYTALCTSTNGGVKRGSASTGGSVIVTNLSLGASYTCTVTASNARGVGGAAKVGPIRISK
jgi:titin